MMPCAGCWPAVVMPSRNVRCHQSFQGVSSLMTGVGYPDSSRDCIVYQSFYEKGWSVALLPSERSIRLSWVSLHCLRMSLLLFFTLHELGFGDEELFQAALAQGSRH